MPRRFSRCTTVHTDTITVASEATAHIAHIASTQGISGITVTGVVTIGWVMVFATATITRVTTVIAIATDSKQRRKQ